MNSTTRSMIAALIAVGGIAGATSAAAQPRRGDSTYQQEVSVCGHNQQDRAACIREAGAARQEAARGGLTSAPDYQRNALARCGLQPPGDRADCEARVLGGSGNTRGNAVMPAPMPAPSRVPAPAIAPMTPIAPMEPMPAPMPAPAR
jgi:hypothetical protein